MVMVECGVLCELCFLYWIDGVGMVLVVLVCSVELFIFE